LQKEAVSEGSKNKDIFQSHPAAEPHPRVELQTDFQSNDLSSDSCSKTTIKFKIQKTETIDPKSNTKKSAVAVKRQNQNIRFGVRISIAEKIKY